MHMYMNIYSMIQKINHYIHVIKNSRNDDNIMYVCIDILMYIYIYMHHTFFVSLSLSPSLPPKNSSSSINYLDLPQNIPSPKKKHKS